MRVCRRLAGIGAAGTCGIVAGLRHGEQLEGRYHSAYGISVARAYSVLGMPMGTAEAQLPTWPRLERRHQTIRLRDRHWNPTSVESFRRRRPSPYERNAAISRHFERDPISYALETDWPVGAADHAKSRIRSRIEHVFGAQQSAPGGRIVRTIGMVRARAKIGLQNLAYNIRRLVTLERLAAA